MTRDHARLAYQAFAPIYDEFHRANNYEMWIGVLLPELEKRGLQHGRVLDIGCGTGRAFKPLLKRDWAIVGCDLSPAMLSEAKRKFGDTVPLHESDIRDLSVFGEFELILALNDVVNYLLEDGELERALMGMRANLAPGGLVLFDTNTLATLQWSSAEAGVQNRGAWLWEGLTKQVVPGAVVESRISGPGLETHVHRERHYTVEEIHQEVAAAGMSVLGTLGQRETDDGLLLTEPADEVRDHKVIHICR